LELPSPCSQLYCRRTCRRRTTSSDHSSALLEFQHIFWHVFRSHFVAPHGPDHLYLGNLQSCYTGLYEAAHRALQQRPADWGWDAARTTRLCLRCVNCGLYGLPTFFFRRIEGIFGYTYCYRVSILISGFAFFITPLLSLVKARVVLWIGLVFMITLKIVTEFFGPTSALLLVRSFRPIINERLPIRRHQSQLSDT
jgi:hypothetical protein